MTTSRNNLPPKLAVWLSARGHDAIHTLDLDDGDRTSDEGIAAIADDQQRVVISKDEDFRVSHQLRATPRVLLLVTTGKHREP